MPKRCRAVVLAACLLVLAACAAPTRPQRPPPPRASAVVLISIDGFRADYLDRGLTPTLAALAADGVRARALKPAFPTLTFPNHYTLVTGLYPDHHGIVNNRIRDAQIGATFVYKDANTVQDPRWWGGEPIWVGAERQGVHAATMFWPGSDVAIGGVRPSHWRRFDASLAPERRVDQLLEWIDEPPPRRARFYTLYFEQVDHAGHEAGPDSAEVDAALRAIDTALARLVAGLARRGLSERTDLVVVSDHGMTKTAAPLRTYLDDVVPLADVDVVNYGTVAGIAPRGARAAAAERALLAPHAHMRCWRKQDVPARLVYGRNPRIPPLICAADDGGIVTSHGFDDGGGHYSQGEHGYDNADPAMRALFVAHGPSFGRGLVVPEFDNVDVYPLLAHLLGVRPAPNDGDYAAVAPMLRDPRP